MKLDYFLQYIVFHLEMLPEIDFIPSIELGFGFSDLIPSMFGIEFDYINDSAINKTYYFKDLDSLTGKVDEMPEINIMKEKRVVEILNEMDLLLEVTKGRLDIAYPQLQGPLSNVARMLPQEEMLCGTIQEPEAISKLAMKIWRVAVDIQKALIDKDKDTDALRTRSRFCPPKWIKGLIVEDYISVLRPEDYLELLSGAYEMTNKELGPIFQHTCGPSLQSSDVIKNLPGMVGFETAFVNKNTKTTYDVEQQERTLCSRRNHFGALGIVR